MDFGVFYTCYTEKRAVDYSLEILFNVYPDVPVYLVSDGGGDYYDVQQKWRSRGFDISANLEEDSRGIIPSLVHRTDFYDENIQEQVYKSVTTFLNRVRKSIEYCNREFTLVMEPDVLVRGKLNNPMGHRLLGSRINVGMSNEIRDVIKSHPGSIDVNRWGLTPAIFNSESFIMMHDTVTANTGLLGKLCRADRRFANYDFMFAALFALVGIEEKHNPEIVECFRDYSWESSWHPLVHQYRAKYPLSSDGYDGTHVRNKNGMMDSWLWKR